MIGKGPPVKKPAKGGRGSAELETRGRFHRLAYIGGACLFMLLFSTVVSVLSDPTMIDESKLVQKRLPIFEEPNPPAGEVPQKKGPAVESLRPQVAIIIDDMGYHGKVGRKLIALPLHLSFSFLPYAPFTRQQEAEAFTSGHTVMLHLPMQPQGRQWNPGPGALYLGQSDGLQEKILNMDLSWVPHAMGVNNHMGSLYTQNPQAMRSLLVDLGHKGLFFVDSVTTPKSAAYRLARKLGIKTGRRQIFLDNIQSKEKIRLQLDKLMSEAGREGRAIGIGHPYPETLQVLTDELPMLNARVTVEGVDKLIQ